MEALAREGRTNCSPGASQVLGDGVEGTAAGSPALSHLALRCGGCPHPPKLSSAPEPLRALPGERQCRTH